MGKLAIGDTRNIIIIFIWTMFDYYRAKAVQSMEELRDVYQHFLLYYGPDIPKMKNAMKARKRREREERGEDPDNEEGDEEEEETLKQASRNSGYSMCVKAGLGTVWIYT